MSGDPIPAIAETEAAGTIAALYADIRATLGVNVVNLVWRHLATVPGALDAIWAAVKPVYVSGQVATAAGALRETLPLPVLPRWPRAALLAAGVDLDGVGAVLASYDRSNAMNQVALTAALLKLDGVSPDAAVVARPDGGGIAAPLPTLLALDAMAPATAELVRAIDRLGERQGVILASMYRHLAHWPGFLAMAWTLIAPLAADGRLERIIAEGRNTARQQARGLLGGLGGELDALPAEKRAFVHRVLSDFTTHPIGKMVPICALIRRAMPD